MDVILMALALGCGYANASAWWVAVIGLLLTLQSLQKSSLRQLSGVPQRGLLVAGTSAMMANNLVFALMAFLLGHGAAWLLSQ